MIKIKNLSASIEGKNLIKGVSLDLEEGKKYLLMGPNGSGKTTLAMAIVGCGNAKAKSGSIKLIENGKTVDLSKLSIEGRAKKGVFIGFQGPVEIPGVNFYDMMFYSYIELHPEEAKKTKMEKFFERITKTAQKLGIAESLLERDINKGFSGGERKKMELLQMVVLEPKYVILDEPDSGLDADSVKIVGRGLDLLPSKTSVLIISHNPERLDIREFDKVYVMKEGKIVKSGGNELIDDVSKRGYDRF
ncbi:Fe-S cluster assembly ATPase SufC [Candidatus Dojkabacteria bacterium]|nr:Fe-S cluster assembly ATPase SufC [Candidatus Dojkabacteria bacterium]